jgi:hypothetical protein
MISRDYTKEVGIASQKKTFPRPVAYLVLAVVAVGVSFGVAGVLARTKEHKHVEKVIPAAAAAPVAAVPAGK